MKYQIAIRQCTVCGKDYQPTSTRQKYCSLECRNGVAICQFCGEQFIPIDHTKGKFCSKKCRSLALSNPKTRIRPCPVCGREFKPKVERQQTCSRDCAAQLQWKRHKKCIVCGQEFIGKTSQQMTCSHDCAGVLRRGERNRYCERCGKEMPFDRYRFKRFCSPECRVSPLWNIVEASTGYLMVKAGKDYPGVDRRGYILQHRYVMEQMIGRYLLSQERVHHKNGDKKDNHPENLELWTLRHKDPPGVRISDAIISSFAKQPEIQALDEETRNHVLEALKRVSE